VTSVNSSASATNTKAYATVNRATTSKAPDDNWSAKIDAFDYKGLAVISYEFCVVTSSLNGNLTSSDPVWSAQLKSWHFPPTTRKRAFLVRFVLREFQLALHGE